MPLPVPPRASMRERGPLPQVLVDAEVEAGDAAVVPLAGAVEDLLIGEVQREDVLGAGGLVEASP